MAIRKIKEESYMVRVHQQEWVTKAKHALLNGGFENVKDNMLLSLKMLYYLR